MRSKWKWIFGIAGFLLVALLVAVYIVLSSYDFNHLKPQITRAAKDATGRELALTGNIDLKISFSPALVVEGVTFQNASWGSRPEMAKIKRFEVQVAVIPLISGRIEIKRLILIEPDILIETDKSGKSNLDFETLKKADSTKKKEEGPREEKEKLPALTIAEFRIEKGRVTYKDGQSGSAYNMMIDSLTAAVAGVESPIKLKLKGTFNDEALEVTGTLGPLGALTNSDKPWPLQLTANMAGANLNIDGKIKDVPAQRGIELNFAAKGKDLGSLGKLTGKPLPVKGPFDISGRITDPAVKTYKITGFKMALGESDLGGTVEANVAGKRPKLTAALSSQKMDLRSLLPEGKGPDTTVGKTKKASKAERIFPDDPLPLDALRQVDAALKIQTGKVLLPQLAINDLTVEMILDGGRLTIMPLKAVIGGGNLDGRINLQSQGRVADLTVMLKVDHLDVGRMLKELNINEVMEGNLSADIDLKGTGGSVAALMAGLNGKTSIVMDKGNINNKYIDLLGADISSSIFRLVNPVKEEASYTAVNCFVCGFNMKDGLADTTALVLDTSRMGVVGGGTINLKTERLNLSLKPVPKEGGGTTKSGKLTLSLSELSKPFRLGGTLAQPSLAIDPTETAMTLGKVVGGATLFGPKGATGALVGAGPGDKNPCLTAIEAARKGVKHSEVEKPVKGKGAPGEAAEGGKESVPDLGKELKKFFGK
ncbi:MAG: hypothetical protein A2W09_01080 [Deltaproteobacteria bacterium RBG_16_50_11]|nr:MAG: hypothetical protein A2W09_01080 [Deltaproteobacteria bacterium RBG_16_50_11]